MPQVGPLPQSVSLRAWQMRAVEKFHALNQPDFFLSATPGAGKTRLALKLAHDELAKGAVERIAVLVQNENLKKQWAAAAKSYGIDLDHKFASGNNLASDFHGVAITYQQMAMSPEFYRRDFSRSTLVIFDEVHHLADDKTWGAAARQAFGAATRRIALSGTPFRSDNIAIPFLTYDADSISVPDFRYGYEHALSDTNADPAHGVCRPVYFPSFEGEVDWRSKNGRNYSSRFVDELGQALSAERLRTAITAVDKGEWLSEVIRKADQKITEVREEGHVDAAGLVIAMDQDHAKNIVRVLLEVTGARPTLAISLEPQAAEYIEVFKNGTARWIVAVKMVSEGVDIPRLRVAVYATNVTTEMAFRQAVGRVIRWIPGIDDQAAYFYIPRHPAFVVYAEQIKAERKHQCEELDIDHDLRDIDQADRTASQYAPEGARALPDVTIALDGLLTSSETIYAESIRQISGVQITTENLVRVLRAARIDIPQYAQPPVAARPESLLDDEKDLLRKKINSRVHLYSLRSEEKHSFIHSRLNALGGVKNIKEESLAGLERRLERITAWLDAWQEANRTDAVESPA